jgi:methylated-DNA-[protein]-cysteine S-methyltransferase
VQELQKFQAKLVAPFGVLGVQVWGEQLMGIEYLPSGIAPLAPQTRFAKEVCRQLAAYFQDANFCFDLPCQIQGTVFQRRVWDEVRMIRCGYTLSYTELASHVESAPRPVASACGANRLPLLIPCHRVVASRGIGGFMHRHVGYE